MIKTLKAVISYLPLARINPVPNMYAILRGLVFHSISGYRESVAHLLGVRQPVNGGSLLLGTSVGTIQGVRLRTVWVCLQKKHKNRRCPDRKLLVLQGSRTPLKTAAKLKKSPQKILLTGMPIVAQKRFVFLFKTFTFYTCFGWQQKASPPGARIALHTSNALSAWKVLGGTISSPSTRVDSCDGS